MAKKRKIIILAAVVISVVLLAAVGFILPPTFDLEAYRAGLIQAVKTELNRDIRYARGELSLRPRPSFTFTDVVVLDKESQAVFFAADRLSFKLTLLPLLRKKVVLREVVLENPRVALIRDASGTFNISDLLNDKRDLSFGIRRLQIHNGLLHFTDHRFAPEIVKTSLEGLNLHMSRIERGKAADISLIATVVDAVKSGNLSFVGSVEIAKASEPLINSRIDAAVRANNLNVECYWPYYSSHVPFKKLTGRLNIDARYRGHIRQFESRGTMTLHDLYFEYPPVFRVPLKPKTVHAVYDMKLDPRDINVTQLDIAVDGVHVRGSCMLKDIHAVDPLIDAKAVSTEISWEAFSHYIPFGIIPKDVADFIEQKIKAGIFQLNEGRLYGRISQIVHMEKGENCNVLHIRGRTRQSILEYAPDIPVFTDIAGMLELKGKDFILSGMTGKFGDAPVSLDGKLADYCLETPTRYPFTMKMFPTAKEIAWLFGRELIDHLNYDGKSALLLSGDGDTTNYNISGDWNLAEASYRYQEWLVKPAGRANHFKLNINARKGGTVSSSVQYHLTPLLLAVSAKYRHTGKRGLFLAIDTNSVPLEEMASLLPKIEKVKPRGEIRLSVKARSGPKDLSDLNWRGQIALTGVSFNPGDPIKPVSHMTGKLHLQGKVIEASQMDLYLGDSAVSAQGKIANFMNPTYSITFSSEQIDTADLGLRNPQQPVTLQNINGTIIFKDRDLQIDALTFRLNDSIFNIKGDVRNVSDKPVINIDVASPYLDWRDIVIIGDLKRADKTGESLTGGSGTTLKAGIRADAGRMGGLAFEKLQTRLSLDDHILNFEKTAFNALGGTLTGDGRIDLAGAGTPRYHFNFDLDKLSAEKCLELIDVKDRFITGAFSAKGNLTAGGVNKVDLKKTARGNVRIQIEEGMLAKFAVLSKIFSILNVSQLLKFQLPDMVSGGMPYDKIVATLSFEDGIVSTKDFFIDSDAMNISAIAAIDMPKGEFVDTSVGVQPLQTVDKLVSLIPVVGWILTDEKRSLVTVYFNVKGSLGNPDVTAIPVKSMAKGVFEIFQNIFRLPVKLFTDTGEVIFGR